MITVSILLNGRPIYTRTAVNQGKDGQNGGRLYRTDCGSVIEHDRGDGAIALAHKMLQLIDPRKETDDEKSLADLKPITKEVSEKISEAIGMAGIEVSGDTVSGICPQCKKRINSKDMRGFNIHRAKCLKKYQSKGGMPTAERSQSPEPTTKKGGFFRGILGR